MLLEKAAAACDRLCLYQRSLVFVIYFAESFMSDEKRLIKKLLEDYDRVGIVGRPVHNTSETIKVGYGLSLIQILDLDEKNQVLTTNVWSRYVRFFSFERQMLWMIDTVGGHQIEA